LSDALKAALGRQVLVCVGSGGVGKTTTAAALGLMAAMEGRKVLVCTIDPARRLANSMGLASLGNTEALVPDAAFAALGQKPKGELWAMMLDLKRSWDEVITRYATSDAQRDAVLANRFYQQMSTALAGSQEYVAMEKLHALVELKKYDLILLDTPPTTHALDFLEAPTKVIDFLDNDFARLLGGSVNVAGRVGARVLQASGATLSKILARFTGEGTLEELGRFMSALSGMYEGFKQRAVQVQALLKADGTRFVLVTSPSAMQVGEALHFHELLGERSLRVAAVIANRVNPDFLKDTRLTRLEVMEAAAQLDVPHIPGLPSVGERLWTTLQDEQVLHKLDEAQLAVLAKGCPGTPVVPVPRFDHDIHDLAGLYEVGQRLLQADARS
jgi:anion-transporting  ArsA/GET3 family ATPase